MKIQNLYINGNPPQYILNMKKFVLTAAAAAVILFTVTGCAKRVDYSDYVSERRTDIFVYEDDDVSIKAYCSEKEQPYAADGIKGEMCPVVELFVSLPKNPQELNASVEGLGGEMNYRAVENCYYLSFSAQAFNKTAVDITLDYDGESKTYSALSVKYDGVMSCDEAVLCAVEYNRELFDKLTAGGLFDGEIYVRLLHDEGCYYYVGVCDKQKHITAFLIDGEHGKVITTKEIDA